MGVSAIKIGEVQAAEQGMVLCVSWELAFQVTVFAVEPAERGREGKLPPSNSVN